MIDNGPIPVISCIIPTYNRGSLLKEAVDSVINQTFTNWELIIVDNGSTDNTIQLINEYIKRDNRVRYYECIKKGPAAVRNLGVSKARGEYISFLDDDDISLPHRFKSQIEAVEKSGKKFIVSGYEVRNRSNNKLVFRKLNELKGFGAGFPSRWFISKSLFDRCNGFDEELLTMEDPEFSYRVAQHEIFASHLSVVSILYDSSDSISHRGKTLYGKEQMMEKAGHLMHPVEKAWWYFVIGLEYYKNNKTDKALLNFGKATESDSGIRYKIGYLYAKKFLQNPVIPIRINLRILSLFINYPLTRLVDHLVVS